MNYSYERISTLKQDERRQEIALNNIKIDKRFIDKLSGKNADQSQLNKLMLAVTKGDNIYCESISRLGRNVDDLRSLCNYFIEKGAVIHFIKEGFSTTGSSYKFLLTILGAVGEMERELIVDRVREGIEKAKIYGTKSGKPIGRPERAVPKDFEKYYKQWKAKEITAVEFSKLLGISRATLYRYIKYYRKDVIFEKENNVAKIDMHLRVENNNKFVRGKSKTRASIEQYLQYYNMKQPDSKQCEYTLFIKYEDIKNLENTLYSILQEIDSIADWNNCFIEADVRCDELGLQW